MQAGLEMSKFLNIIFLWQLECLCTAAVYYRLPVAKMVGSQCCGGQSTCLSHLVLRIRLSVRMFSMLLEPSAHVRIVSQCMLCRTFSPGTLVFPTGNVDRVG
jgi:hypothetical protein